MPEASTASWSLVPWQLRSIAPGAPASSERRCGLRDPASAPQVSADLAVAIGARLLRHLRGVGRSPAAEHRQLDRDQQRACSRTTRSESRLATSSSTRCMRTSTSRASWSRSSGRSSGRRGQRAGRSGRQRSEDAPRRRASTRLPRSGRVPQQLWEDANRRAHGRFLKVIEGGGDVVSHRGRRGDPRPLNPARGDPGSASGWEAACRSGFRRAPARSSSSAPTSSSWHRIAVDALKTLAIVLLSLARRALRARRLPGQGLAARGAAGLRVRLPVRGCGRPRGSLRWPETRSWMRWPPPMRCVLRRRPCGPSAPRCSCRSPRQPSSTAW